MTLDKNNHNFNFEGGKILRHIGAAWFVSYSYYKIDSTHLNWKFGITEKSLESRRLKFDDSQVYHRTWLNEVLNMENLDRHKNAVNLSSNEIKELARKVLASLK